MIKRGLFKYAWNLELLAVLLGPTPPAGRAVADDSLAGTYQVQRVEQSGKTLAPDSVARGFIFTKDRVSIYGPGELHALLSIDERATPHRLEIRNRPEYDVLFHQRGIWKREGAHLTVCVSDYSQEAVYPARLESSPRDDWICYRLKKVELDCDRWKGQWLVHQAILAGRSDAEQQGQRWSFTTGKYRFETNIEVQSAESKPLRQLTVFSTPFDPRRAFIYYVKPAATSDDPETHVQLSGTCQFDGDLMRLTFGKRSPDFESDEPLNTSDPWSNEWEYVYKRVPIGEERSTRGK